MITEGDTSAGCKFNRFSDLDAPDYPGCNPDYRSLPCRWRIRDNAAEAGRHFGKDGADLSIEPFNCVMDERYPAFPRCITQQEPCRIIVEPVDDHINTADKVPGLGGTDCCGDWFNING